MFIALASQGQASHVFCSSETSHVVTVPRSPGNLPHKWLSRLLRLKEAPACGDVRRLT